jgi:site-specific recombinase XerD
MPTTVTIKPLEIENKPVLGLFFPFNETLKSIAKNNGALWNASARCWWMPETKSNLDLLFSIYKGKAWLDIKALKRAPQKSKSNTYLKSDNNRVPQAYIDLLKRRRYSPSTLKTYVSLFNAFLNYFPEMALNEITEASIKAYQDYLVNKRKVSSSMQNQSINAIKFYLEKVLNQDRQVYFIERPRKEKRLPTVLSEDEVLKILAATEYSKHKVALALLYSGGLRISELINLHIGDVDLDRKTIFIRNAKQKKDRITLLSEQLTPYIASYLAEYKPNYWFIEGAGRKQYSASSLRQVLKRSVAKTDIKKKVTLHTLRHSFATHLLEAGTDLRYIQELLGHSSPKTTEIYTHVSKRHLQNIKSPLDEIFARNKVVSGDTQKIDKKI